MEMIQLNVTGNLELAEIQYFFQLIINSKMQTLALVSVYSPVDRDLLKESYNTLWTCTYQGDQALKVIDVTMITAVIALLPLPGGQDGTLFLCEKPGLDVAHIGGQDEILTDK